MKRLSILFLAIVAATAVWAGGPKKIKIDPAVLDSLRNANALLMQKVEMLSQQIEAYKDLSEVDKTTIAGQKEQIQQLTKQLADLKEAEPANINTDGNVFGGGCGADLRWKFTKSTGTLEISGTGAMGDYNGWDNYAPWYSYSSNIWKVILNDGITKIGNHAFYKCEKFSSIEIPSSVKEIGTYAFRGCTGLTSLTIPSGVKEIGSCAFLECSGLTSLTIPSSVTEIGSGAFSGCSGLTSLTIPSSVTKIGNIAFSECTGLTSITIPSSVKEIGDRAFSGCYALTSIVVESGNPNYDSRDNCNAIIETASNMLVAGCKTTRIPNGVKGIGRSAFSGCSGLTSLTIPSSVTKIGGSAFSGCSGLTSLTIPNCVTSIGSWAFSGCSGLKSITIPNSVTEICDSAFFRCSGLTSIVVESGNPNYDSRNGCNAIIEKASNKLIVGCKNTRIPNGVKEIGGSAFQGCYGLTSITIPSSVKKIEYGAFFYCSGLTSITIPSNVKEIGGNAFSDCTKLRLRVPRSARYKDFSFDNCASVTFY